MPDYGDVPTRRRRRGLLAAVLVGAVAATLTVATTMTAEAAVLASDTFEDGDAAGWTTTGGGWSVVADTSMVYRQGDPGAADARAVYGFTGAGSGPFTVTGGKAKLNAPLGPTGSVELLTLTQDAGTYYYLAIKPTTLELGRRDGGARTTLATTPFAPAAGVTYSMSINMFFGDRVTGSVSGPAGRTDVVALGPPPTGLGTRIGVATQFADASFDDINVADDRIAPTSSAPVTTPPVTTPPAAPCQATYVVNKSWPGGFQASLRVRNTGPAPLSAWRLTWTFANGQTIASGWNGVFSQSGAAVTVRNAAWNGSVAPGASVAAGFLGRWNNAINQPPTVTCAVP